MAGDLSNRSGSFSSLAFRLRNLDFCMSSWCVVFLPAMSESCVGADSSRLPLQVESFETFAVACSLFFEFVGYDLGALARTGNDGQAFITDGGVLGFSVSLLV